MALTFIRQPYEFTLKNQRLLFVVSSSNSFITGFKYYVTVLKNSTSQSYEFYIPPAPDGRLYYDLNSIALLRHNEGVNHKSPTVYDEPAGAGQEMYRVSVVEATPTGGTGPLTPNMATLEYVDVVLLNGSYQYTDGDKPDSFTGSNDVAISFYLNEGGVDSSRRAYTDIKLGDYWNKYARLGNAQTVHIPVRKDDYGLLWCSPQKTSTYFQIAKYRVRLWGPPVTGLTPTLYETYESGLLATSYLSGLPVYPKNITSAVYGWQLSDNPDWLFYDVTLVNAAGTKVAEVYRFVNMDYYGIVGDTCRFPLTRLAWVNSRGGWDYFTFSAKQEKTYEIERKRYKKVIGRQNGAGNSFEIYDRGITERGNIVFKTETLTSGFLTEGQFRWLRGLFLSSQVQVLTSGGYGIGVVVEDTSYLERYTRDGKQYNVTIKIKYSNHILA